MILVGINVFALLALNLTGYLQNKTKKHFDFGQQAFEFLNDASFAQRFFSIWIFAIQLASKVQKRESRRSVFFSTYSAAHHVADNLIST